MGYETIQLERLRKEDEAEGDTLSEMHEQVWSWTKGDNFSTEQSVDTLGTDAIPLPPISCLQRRGQAAAKTCQHGSRILIRGGRTGSHNGAGYVTSQFWSSTESRLRLFNAVLRMDCAQRWSV